MITIDKWKLAAERGSEECTPSSPGSGSCCVHCGRAMDINAQSFHPVGDVTYTVEFWTRDDMPNEVNLRMFNPELPDLVATVLRYTPQPQSYKCVATFVQQEDVRK